VVSRDSYDAGEPSEADDLVTPVLCKALSFMRIDDVGVVRAGGSLAVNLGKVSIEDHLERYAPEVAALAGS
jgi:FMN-dependent NADH-azoreductase